MAETQDPPAPTRPPNYPTVSPLQWPTANRKVNLVCASNTFYCPRFVAHWPWTVYGERYHPRRHEHTSATLPVVCNIEITEVRESIACGPNQFCTGPDMSSSKLGMAVGDKHVHGRHAQISHFILAQELTLNASSRRKILSGSVSQEISLQHRSFDVGSKRMKKKFIATKAGAVPIPLPIALPFPFRYFSNVCGRRSTLKSACPTGPLLPRI